MIRAVVLSLFLVTPALAGDKVVTPEEAAKMVGMTVTLEMQVKAFGIAKPKGGGQALFLESKADPRAADNFSVRIAPKVVKTFKEQDLEKVARSLRGKTIRVKGEVKKPEDPLAPEGQRRIDVEDPSQFKVVEK